MSNRITKKQAARLMVAVRRRLMDDLVEKPEVFIPELTGDLDHQLELLDFDNLPFDAQAELLVELGFNPMNVTMKPVCDACGSDNIQVDGHATFDEDLGDWVLQGIRDDTHVCNSEECNGAECGVSWVAAPPKEEDGDA